MSGPVGLKRYRIDRVYSESQRPTDVGIETISAFDAESAVRKAFRRAGGFTIGYRLTATEIP